MLFLIGSLLLLQFARSDESGGDCTSCFSGTCATQYSDCSSDGVCGSMLNSWINANCYEECEYFSSEFQQYQCYKWNDWSFDETCEALISNLATCVRGCCYGEEELSDCPEETEEEIFRGQTGGGGFGNPIRGQQQQQEYEFGGHSTRGRRHTRRRLSGHGPMRGQQMNMDNFGGDNFGNNNFGGNNDHPSNFGTNDGHNGNGNGGMNSAQQRLNLRKGRRRMPGHESQQEQGGNHGGFDTQTFGHLNNDNGQGQGGQGGQRQMNTDNFGNEGHQPVLSSDQYPMEGQGNNGNGGGMDSVQQRFNLRKRRRRMQANDNPPQEDDNGQGQGQGQGGTLDTQNFGHTQAMNGQQQGGQGGEFVQQQQGGQQGGGFTQQQQGGGQGGGFQQQNFDARPDNGGQPQ